MSSGKKKAHRGYWIFIKTQIVLIVLILLAVAYYFIGGYAKTIKELHNDALEKVYGTTSDVFRNNETSLCYDADGELISVLKGDRDVYYLTYENIPSYVLSAFVSTEDRKFYKHIGVDFQAIARAAWAAVRNGEITQGASTITQQLARNVFLNYDKTWQRKVEEIFIALELERVYSKNDILEFYVNNIYFANGYYGIEAAAKGYFNTEASKLSLSQIAFLCSIPNNPSLYDPLTNMENTLSRRDRVLQAMYDEGYISMADLKNATEEEITLNQPESVKNDYLETYTYYCAVRALMADAGFEFKTEFSSEEEQETYEELYDIYYSEYQMKLYTEGYRIYTSLDVDVQEELQSALDEELADVDDDVDDDGIYELQGSATCIDNTTGRVVAIVGGRDQGIAGYTLNRAYQSFRQPGSAIKPLIVYTPALENGYTPDSVVVDEKIEDGPSNANGTYLGEITLRYAVAHSTNTIAWKLFDELTPEVGLSYLLKMNFSHIDEEDYRLPSALGGFTTGVSSLEMASAYATIENGGMYREPTCIVKITDSDGNTVLETTQDETEIYGENAARMMTSMLQSVIKTGTGKGLGIDGISCAGKTGTTNDNKDGWFVGYSYYYTTAVWVGYDTPQKLPGLSGATYPGKIWHNFMEVIHEGLTNVKFKDYISYDIDNETVPGVVEDEEEDTQEETTTYSNETSNETTQNNTTDNTETEEDTSEEEEEVVEDEGEEDTIDSESEEESTTT
ncbi:MAG: PBP1A family penicillin-binding protein [Eubacterium sp.]|nr:PBP1A family penicillin-binding protein [Eubacterium sp.]